MECQICFEPKAVTACFYCETNACQQCLQKYILSRKEAPCCFSCKKEYTEMFIEKATSKTFRTGALREHYKEVLWDREKSLMPATQDLANARKLQQHLEMFQKYEETVRQHHNIIDKMFTQRMTCLNRLTELQGLLEKGMYSDKVSKIILQAEMYNLEHLLDVLDGKPVKRKASDVNLEDLDGYSPMSNETIKSELKRVMVMRADFHKVVVNVSDTFSSDNEVSTKLRQQLFDASSLPVQDTVRSDTTVVKITRACPNESCRGFCDHRGQCGMCQTKVCLSCWMVAADKHECRAEDVATKEMIMKDSKPCPKCQTFIYRTEGCDHMWCTKCKTGFNWKTLKIISDRHNTNPLLHAWESSRQQQQGCSGDRNGYRWVLTVLSKVVGTLKKIGIDKNVCMHLLRTLEIHVRNYNNLVDTEQSVEHRMEQLRVMYLCKEIDEDTFKTRATSDERMIRSSSEVQQALGLFMDSISYDVLLYQEKQHLTIAEGWATVVHELMLKLEKHRLMFNECVENTALKYFASTNVSIVRNNKIREDWTIEGHAY